MQMGTQIYCPEVSHFKQDQQPLQGPAEGGEEEGT